MEPNPEEDPKSFLGIKDPTTLTSYLDSPKLQQASTNASRLVNKLKAAVENQALYETQQILRTIYFRFINNPEKVDALSDLLYYGAIHQLEYGEHISGQDIATLFLEASAKILQARLENSTDLNVDDQTETIRSKIFHHLENQTADLLVCRKISSLAVLLPDTEIGQTKFIAEALRLLPPKILNRDLLHEVLAVRFYEAKDYANARYHFLHSACAGQKAVFMLVEFHSEKGTKSEVDLFITQFVLQFLCIQHPTDSPVAPAMPGQSRHQRNTVTPSNLAISKKSRTEIKERIRYIFLEYINLSRHPDLAKISKPYDLPLLNFVLLLTSILDSTKSEATAFKFLIDTYEKPLSRDPNFRSYLNRIGVPYFGLPDATKQQQQQAGGGGGFFNNILMSLLEGADDDDEEEVPEERAPNVMSSFDDLD